ncbi:hypothetical protein BBJ28_00009904 [Nothophytophthora sp. Chile5]|nr:hypothetical protein BBJ28_00009904 [Nothophytophthora sp. Chile5]
MPSINPSISVPIKVRIYRQYFRMFPLGGQTRAHKSNLAAKVKASDLLRAEAGDRASASLSTMLEDDQGHAWGRFTIVSKHPAEESDHIYFSRKRHQIGRNPQRCDIVINKLFSEDQKAKQEISMIPTGAESPEPVQPTPCTQDNTSPSEKKRRRVDEEVANVVVISSQELEEKLRTAENQVATLTAKATHLELAVQSGSSQLEQEKKALIAKLEAATAENFELKSTLASKEQELTLKLEEAADKYKHQRESERKAKGQEMDAKLKEATKKYQQKVEAEHYEQRREMSQKMAAFAHESDKLQTELGTKEEALTECEEKIAELEEQLAVSKRQLSMKETELAECVEKISELEDTLNESKEENSEMIGLLAAAEEKVAAAEEKASRAAITAAAAASNSNGTEARERQQLQEAIASLRSQLEASSAQSISLQDEVVLPAKGQLAAEGNDTLVMEEAKEGVLGPTGQKTSTEDGGNVPMAEPKAVATSETKWPKKKKANKQEAPLSAVIETDAASAIAAMASADSSAKSSPSETNTAAMSSASDSKSHEDGDWEMLE